MLRGVIRWVLVELVADAVQVDLAEKKEKVLQEKSKAEEELKNLEKAREELLPKIPSDQIKLYKQISSKKNGIL